MSPFFRSSLMAILASLWSYVPSPHRPITGPLRIVNFTPSKDLLQINKSTVLAKLKEVTYQIVKDRFSAAGYQVDSCLPTRLITVEPSNITDKRWPCKGPDWRFFRFDRKLSESLPPAKTSRAKTADRFRLSNEPPTSGSFPTERLAKAGHPGGIRNCTDRRRAVNCGSGIS